MAEATPVLEGSEMSTAAKTDHQPRVKPPDPPEVEKLFSIYQEKEEDIQMYWLDVSRPIVYLGALHAMKRRQSRLSPLKIFGIPVTPLINPKSKFSSVFIIRLFDSTNDERYFADLLFRDSDLYFVGFRRWVKLTAADKALLLRGKQEEEAESSKKGEKEEKKEKKIKKSGKEKAKEREEKEVRERRKRGGSGQWYRFDGDGFDLPDFLNAKSCGISGGYTSIDKYVKPGGQEAFDEMLRVLGTFEDGHASEEELKKVCYTVMVMFAEATRLRSVFREMMKRVVQNASMHAFYDADPKVTMWKNINNWTQLGTVPLKVRMMNRLDLKATMESLGEEWCANKHKLETLDDLVGTHGEIMLINVNLDYIGYSRSELDKIYDNWKDKNTGPACKRDIIF